MRNDAIHLYFPIENLDAAVRLVAVWAGMPQMHRSTLVVSGHRLEMPFDPGWRGDPVDLTCEGEVSYDLSLWIPEDKAFRTYTRSSRYSPPSRTRGSNVEHQIGNIGLRIRIGAYFAELAFIAVTSDMSEYFFTSSAVQSLFLKLNRRLHGVAALYWECSTMRHDPFLLLSDRKTVVSITHDMAEHGMTLWVPVDVVAEQVMAQQPR